QVKPDDWSCWGSELQRQLSTQAPFCDAMRQTLYTPIRCARTLFIKHMNRPMSQRTSGKYSEASEPACAGAFGNRLCGCLCVMVGSSSASFTSRRFHLLMHRTSCSSSKFNCMCDQPFSVLFCVDHYAISFFKVGQ